MRALVKRERAEGISFEERERPTIGPNDVLIRIRKTAICGTDLHIYRWDPWAAQTIEVPLVVGHEFAGEVVEVGSHVAGFREGDRVSGEGHLTCGHCRNCRAGKRHLCRSAVGVGIGRPGCFADYLALPATNAFKLPDSIPDDIGAFLDPLGNATHTALSFDLVGEDVLITGAGPIGCLAAAIARHVGARNVVVTDIHDYRLELARKLGASRVVNVQEETLDETMLLLGMTEGFDVGLEMSGSGEAFSSMLDVMNHGGRIALLGLPPDEVSIDLSRLVFKGLVLKGIYGREIFETWYKMVSMLQSGLDVSPIVTHHFHVEQYEEAFEVMRSGQCGKVILDWT